MEILTLLKANIRHKKGSFISIILLMIIISMSLTTVLSVKDNCKTSIENALKQANAADLTVYISDRKLTDELMSDVQSHNLVKSVVDVPAIVIDKSEVNGKTNQNDCFLLRQPNELRMLNSNLTGYADETPGLSKGEIYVTQGVLTNMNCKIGDKIKLYTIGGEYSLTIKGVVVEPVNGSSSIGWKQLFISDSDFMTIHNNAVEEVKDDCITADYHILKIYKIDDCDFSSKEFKKQLNLDIGIIDNSMGSMQNSQSLYYTNLFPDIILSVLMVFIGFLLVIVLIVMSHSISTSIEMEYVSLGVLKSQGFSKGKIRAVFVLQYLLAQLIGAVIGFVLTIPLTSAFANVFQPITAIPAENNISILKSLIFILSILLISGLFIFVITKKIAKISPVRAISGGKSEIYFDSRIKAPISQNALSTSLALRQFTSNKRRYIGTIIIVAILVFFMMSVTILGNIIDSKSAIEAMGVIYTECDVTFNENTDDETIEEIERTIEKYSPIEKSYYMIGSYMSIDGDEYNCSIYKDPEMIVMSKGRAPLYDNEIVITDILSEELALNIGDEVTVSHNDKKGKYIVSGIYNGINDAGLCFAMSFDGAEILGFDSVNYGGYSLAEPEKNKIIAEELNKKYSDILSVRAVDNGGLDSTYAVAINAMKAIIFLFSVVFALVVVSMVCSKAFLQEKTEIGIYKALGFTSRKLRLQFSLRFLIVSLLGAAVGAVLSALFSEKVLSFLLRSAGLGNLTATFTPLTFIIPIALICICFFLFAYAVSRKIKRIEIKELITE
ncbi:MAG: ABC transporter permease [Ruminococcus sp.]|jgi:ABC-type antimicrobial peptide transport system permease subunit|nr:ABC transporter permease [Ruminococcus sp.]